MSFNPAALDRSIEGDDRDDEPREPACSECGGDDEGGHDRTCSRSFFGADFAPCAECRADVENDGHAPNCSQFDTSECGLSYEPCDEPEGL